MLDIVLLRQVRWESIILVEHMQKFTGEDDSLCLGSIVSSEPPNLDVPFRRLLRSTRHVEHSQVPPARTVLYAQPRGALTQLVSSRGVRADGGAFSVVTMDYQYCQRALRNKQALSEIDIDMGVLHTARLLALSEIVLARHKTSKLASRPFFFTHLRLHFVALSLSLLHHLQVLHDMYRPTTDGGAIQEEATATGHQ